MSTQTLLQPRIVHRQTPQAGTIILGPRRQYGTSTVGASPSAPSNAQQQVLVARGQPVRGGLPPSMPAPGPKAAGLRPTRPYPRPVAPARNLPGVGRVAQGSEVIAPALSVNAASLDLGACILLMGLARREAARAAQLNDASQASAALEAYRQLELIAQAHAQPLAEDSPLEDPAEGSR